MASSPRPSPPEEEREELCTIQAFHPLLLRRRGPGRGGRYAQHLKKIGMAPRSGGPFLYWTPYALMLPFYRYVNSSPGCATAENQPPPSGYHGGGSGPGFVALSQWSRG